MTNENGRDPGNPAYRTYRTAMALGAGLGGHGGKRDAKANLGRGASNRKIGQDIALASDALMMAAHGYANSGIINPLTGRMCGDEFIKGEL